MRNIYLSVLLALVLTTPVYAEFSILPLVTRLEGIGASGGVAVHMKGNWNLTTGAVAGDFTGAGILAEKQWNQYSLSLGGGGFDNVNLVTTYKRGIVADDPYIQNLTGYGMYFSAKRSYWSKKFWASWKLAIVNLTINSYSNLQGTEIDLGGANLHPVRTFLLTPDFEFDFTKGEMIEQRGVKITFQPSVQFGRTGLSDTIIGTAIIRHYQPLSKQMRWAIKVSHSRASVLFEKKEYNTDAEVRSELNANCSGSQECLDLETDLVNQILAENTKGTVAPIGGASNLRGYRQFRFKATNTATINTELLWDLNWKNVHVGMFVDIGYASDKASQLYDNNATSYGAEVLVYHNGIPVRIGGAQNDKSDTAWYLTAGAVF